MANQVANGWKGQLWNGYLADVYKMILMQPGFVFDPENHAAKADVVASELPTGNGYTAGGKTLTGIALTIDHAEARAELTWDNVQWDAAAGSLAVSGAIIYNDTAVAGAVYDETDAIVAYIDAGGTITATDGTPIIVSNVMVTTE